MHQVLSYETAIRANSSREFREYVTKRTCVSLILSIAFFTLISGYLLGNFVAERKQHIRKIVSTNPLNPERQNQNSVELTDDDYKILKDVQTNRNAKSKLLSSAQTLSAMFHRDESYKSTSLNSEIFNKYISCTQDIPPNTSMDTNEFIEQLVEKTAARQRDCIRVIQVIIDSHLDNS